jgi:hypothetical protein
VFIALYCRILLRNWGTSSLDWLNDVIRPQRHKNVNVVCRTHGKDEKCIQKFGNLRGRDCLEDIDIDGRVFSESILKYGIGVCDWIHLAQSRV